MFGVTYADLYSCTKVQETVYEVLTQECELAKVQEARTIPRLKFLIGRTFLNLGIFCFWR